MRIRNEIKSLIKQINNKVKEEGPVEIVVVRPWYDPEKGFPKSDPSKGFFVIRPHFGDED
jgi:hypothetical protein